MASAELGADVDDEGAGWECEAVTALWPCFVGGSSGQRCASAAVCHLMLGPPLERALMRDDFDDDEACYHEHDEECYDYDDRPDLCTHQHCFACGGCQCPGYCDDYQTYNLRPDETGSAAAAVVDEEDETDVRWELD